MAKQKVDDQDTNLKQTKEESAEIKDSAAVLKIMANDDFKLDFSTMLRTRCPLFYVTCNEEKRFLQFMSHFSIVNGYVCYWWDCYNGIYDLLTKQQKEGTTSDKSIQDPNVILEHIIGHAKTFHNAKQLVEGKKKDGVRGYIYILLDYFRFIEKDPDIERRLKAIAKSDSIISTIITGPKYQATDTLENLIPVLDFPYPNREEIKQSLWQVVDSVQEKIPTIVAETETIEEDLINSVNGLTLTEAESAYSKSIVSYRRWNIPSILEEKKHIIRKSGILEFYDNSVSMNDVGGLKNLVGWIKKRRSCFSKEAEEYGLKKPRGTLFLGFPGAGKSLVCKAIASTWNMPLLKLDFGKLFGSLVGESETRAREVIKLAESISPVILWIDEIEKALSGGASSGRTDGGTTSRVLSTFLTWMQEKTVPVFVVATANDHESIPSEFLRAGRFDEIFFVDLPNKSERGEIFGVLLRLRNYKSADFDLDLLANNSENYSGAEIEKAIDQAMLDGFHDKRRKIVTEDISSQFNKFKSLFELRKDDFLALREWADGKCVKANSEEKNTEGAGIDSKRSLDLEIEQETVNDGGLGGKRKIDLE